MSDIGKGHQCGLSWIPVADGETPKNAIPVGDDVYIARVPYEGDILPGKWVPSVKKAFVSYGGKEHEFDKCEVLCDTGLPDHGDW